ncbi:MAG: hypothetical protein ABIC40_00165, partial [bacterium]
VRFIKPHEITLAVDLNRNVPVRVRLYRPDPKDPRNHHIDTIETAAVGQIVELAIPITSINATPKDTVSFTCAIMRGSYRIDSCPLIGTISMIIPDEQYYGELWLE